MVPRAGWPFCLHLKKFLFNKQIKFYFPDLSFNISCAGQTVYFVPFSKSVLFLESKESNQDERNCSLTQNKQVSITFSTPLSLAKFYRKQIFFQSCRECKNHTVSILREIIVFTYGSFVGYDLIEQVSIIEWNKQMTTEFLGVWPEFWYHWYFRIFARM